MEGTDTNSVRIWSYVDEDLDRALHQLAQEEGRSFAGLIRYILRVFVALSPEDRMGVYLKAKTAE